MEFRSFIKKINRIYNILFIILLFLCLCGINVYYYFYKNGILFLNPSNTKITIFSIVVIITSFIYFILYVFRLIYNKIYILKLVKNNIEEDIENDFTKIKFKKDKVIITNNYLIVGAYILKIVKLEEISSIFLTHSYKYENIKSLQIISKDNRWYTIHEYYAEEIFENIKKYIIAKNSNVSFKVRKKDEKIIEKKIIIFEVISVIIVIIGYIYYMLKI